MLLAAAFVGVRDSKFRVAGKALRAAAVCYTLNLFTRCSSNTALVCAANKGHLSICKLLVASGADVKARSWYGS